MDTNKISVLVVGATGQLGSLITKHCLLQPNLQVNILIRNPDKSKELVEQVTAKGGRVIVGDVTKVESLVDSTKGIHTVISALIGDDNTVLEGQRALLRDGEKNGLKRFLPSDFSCDYKKMQLDEHPLLAQRIQFREDIAKSSVKGIHIFLGVFMETYWYFFNKFQRPNSPLTLNYYGSPDNQIDTTSYEDTARFVAAIVNDPSSEGDFEIIGQSVTNQDISTIYEKVKGKPIELHHIGSVEDLVNARNKNKAEGNYSAFIWYAYSVPMVDGRGKLHNPTHQKYGITPVTLEQFLVSRPDL